MWTAVTNKSASIHTNPILLCVFSNNRLELYITMGGVQIFACGIVCERDESWCLRISGEKLGHPRKPIFKFLSEIKGLWREQFTSRFLSTYSVKAIYGQKMKEIDFSTLASKSRLLLVFSWPSLLRLVLTALWCIKVPVKFGIRKAETAKKCTKNFATWAREQIEKKNLLLKLLSWWFWKPCFHQSFALPSTRRLHLLGGRCEYNYI